MALPTLGDESHAVSRHGRDSKTVVSMVSVGSVVAGVTYDIEALDWTGAYGGDHLEILTRAPVDRVQQTLGGQAATARAVL
ncbi:hypothetical protein ACFFKE_30405 [Streptomyces mutabilis]|uniref:hypothetical protein n=1 Tax=Streptomyces mutabilis TaxID=67332 RepID=UPI00177FFFD1|nr:hypothetical protein [Streptomyces mutabilis]GGQ33381.1 hypothetical protein GCM10010279_47300 [Streptomyces mutabilis]